jgi:hypothetical protein
VLVGGAGAARGGGGEAEFGPRRERRVGGEADLSLGAGEADLTCKLGFRMEKECRIADRFRLDAVASSGPGLGDGDLVEAIVGERDILDWRLESVDSYSASDTVPLDRS